MREPRPKQLFPAGGKNLYELLRLDHEPVTIDVFPEDMRKHLGPGRLEQPDTLVYQREFDPMLYFWPVEGQHVKVKFKEWPRDIDRLVQALLRDGAAWITVVAENKNWSGWSTTHDDFPYIYEHWGDAAGFMRRRYGEDGDTVGIVAVPGRGD